MSKFPSTCIAWLCLIGGLLVLLFRSTPAEKRGERIAAGWLTNSRRSSVSSQRASLAPHSVHSFIHRISRRGSGFKLFSHVPIQSQWDTNRSAQWVSPRCEITSLYEKHEGPSSSYQTVHSQWNGTMPTWKSDTKLYEQFQHAPRAEISVTRFPSAARMQMERIDRWTEWVADVSSFPWRYTTSEVAYIVEGEADILPNDGGEQVSVRQGDVVTLPKGLSCTWYIKGKLKKRYKYVTDANAYAYKNMENDHPTVGSVYSGIPEILGATNINEHRGFNGILDDERKF